MQRFAKGLGERPTCGARGVDGEFWVNGPVEGFVDKLKLIKRQMYARAGFELLRRRVLGATG